VLLENTPWILPKLVRLSESNGLQNALHGAAGLAKSTSINTTVTKDGVWSFARLALSAHPECISSKDFAIVPVNR